MHGQQLRRVAHHGQGVHEGRHEDQGGRLPGELSLSLSLSLCLPISLSFSLSLSDLTLRASQSPALGQPAEVVNREGLGSSCWTVGEAPALSVLSCCPVAGADVRVCNPDDGEKTGLTPSLMRDSDWASGRLWIGRKTTRKHRI